MLKKLTKLRGLNILLRQTTPSCNYYFPQNHRSLTTNISLLQSSDGNGRNPFSDERPKKPARQSDFQSSDDPETKLKIIQLEVDIAYQEGRRIPDTQSLKPYHWEYLLSLPSKSARQKYLSYLWQIEKKKENRQEKKLQKQMENAVRKSQLVEDAKQNNHIIYGLTHTTFHLRIYDSTIDRFNNSRLIRAMLHGSKIVLDCSYDEHMNNREAVNAAKQLMLCFAENRMHDDPFDIHHCNVNLNGTTMQSLKRHIPTMLNPDFPMNIHEKCFTEIFPKENLVYLTPHCRKDLDQYNPDDIYIIGAMVDKMNNEPLSLAKAKRLGIRMARLPLEKYLQWGTGSGKSLTLNQMIHIMLDLKSTGDWEKALRHVPRRKTVNFNEDQTKQNRALRSRADELKFHLDTWAKSKKRHGT